MCSIVGDKKVHFHPTKCTYQVSMYLSLIAFLLKFSRRRKVSEVDIFRPCIALKKTATRAGPVWSLAIRFAQWNSNCRESRLATDCQLTFEWYCIVSRFMGLGRVVEPCRGCYILLF